MTSNPTNANKIQTATCCLDMALWPSVTLLCGKRRENKFHGFMLVEFSVGALFVFQPVHQVPCVGTFFSLKHFLTILLFEHGSDIICHRPIHPHPWHFLEEFAMEDAEVGLLCFWMGGCYRCWDASHTSWIVLGMCFVLMGLTFAILSWNLA